MDKDDCILMKNCLLDAKILLEELSKGTADLEYIVIIAVELFRMRVTQKIINQQVKQSGSYLS